MNSNRRALSAAIALGLVAGRSLAQTDQPIRIIIPLSPGTPSDFATRIVATAMGEELKRPIVIDNRPGANGIIAVQELLKARPDGNTLMLGGISPMALNLVMVKNLPYDPQRDFTPVGGIYNAFQAYIVSNNVPVKTFAELVAYARKNPGKLSFGHYSALTKIQFAALAKLAGVELLMVPYKTTTSVYTDLMGGTLDVSMIDVGTALSMSRAGKFKTVAITLPQRSPLSPGVPPAAETVPGLAVPAWSGLVGPPGMPRDAVVRLNTALNASLRRKDTVARLGESLVVPWATSPEQFAAFVDKEIARWTRVAHEVGIQPE